MTRTVQRPWQIYALTTLFALKGVEELFRGVVGTLFYVGLEAGKGTLHGFGLQLAIQSILLSLLLAGATFYVMVALWLGKAASRTWGVAVALVSEAIMLGFLISRPPEFGGPDPLVRTVLVASVVNLSIAGMLIFDTKLSAFLGSTRLTGWLAPRPLRRGKTAEEEASDTEAER